MRIVRCTVAIIITIVMACHNNNNCVGDLKRQVQKKKKKKIRGRLNNENVLLSADGYCFVFSVSKCFNFFC